MIFFGLPFKKKWKVPGVENHTQLLSFSTQERSPSLRHANLQVAKRISLLNMVMFDLFIGTFDYQRVQRVLDWSQILWSWFQTQPSDSHWMSLNYSRGAYLLILSQLVWKRTWQFPRPKLSPNRDMKHHGVGIDVPISWRFVLITSPKQKYLLEMRSPTVGRSLGYLPTHVFNDLDVPWWFIREKCLSNGWWLGRPPWLWKPPCECSGNAHMRRWFSRPGTDLLLQSGSRRRRRAQRCLVRGSS